MPPLSTRPCTIVYTKLPEHAHKPEFLEREIERVDNFRACRVGALPSQSKEAIRSLIARLIETSIQETKPNNHGLQRALPTKLSRMDAVNRKRRLIAMCIRNQKSLNLKSIARFTKSCYQTVSRVYRDLNRGLPVDSYQYNNLKQQGELEHLQRDIEEADGGLVSVADLKRANPTFSRKKILQLLHASDLRWRKLPLPEPKFATYDPPNQQALDKIISEMAQVHAHPEMEMLYIDEMKFPLNQTAKYHWIGKDAVSTIMLNRRQVPDATLTVIALCSTRRFLAVQVFRGEITGQDFLNFVNKSIQSLPDGRRYAILADNASWHKSGLIRKTEAYRYLMFNLPRMFQINMIENAFSAVRAEFRKRRTVETYEEECQQIIQLFLADHNQKRFAGYYRNHLRMLQKYFK